MVADVKPVSPSTLPKADVVSVSSGIKVWPRPSKEDAIALVEHWCGYYGLDVERCKRIVNCESGFNSQAKNKVSSAAGLYQFIRSTWNSTAQKYGKYYPYEDWVWNAEANAELGAYLASTGGWGHWVCK